MVYETNYKRRGIKGCGCNKGQLISKGKTEHGLIRSPEYATWQRIKSRCYNPKNAMYSYYGGRGITVCDRWLQDFSAFYADMGKRPPELTSIDRIDNGRGYEPGNCRWANALTQNRNRRNVILVQGMTLKEWCVSHGWSYKYLHRKYRQTGILPS